MPAHRAVLESENSSTKLQVKIFEEILEQGYSVRKVEEIVKSLSEGEAVKSGGLFSYRQRIGPKLGLAGVPGVR